MSAQNGKTSISLYLLNKINCPKNINPRKCRFRRNRKTISGDTSSNLTAITKTSTNVPIVSQGTIAKIFIIIMLIPNKILQREKNW